MSFPSSPWSDSLKPDPSHGHTTNTEISFPHSHWSDILQHDPSHGYTPNTEISFSPSHWSDVPQHDPSHGYTPDTEISFSPSHWSDVPQHDPSHGPDDSKPDPSHGPDDSKPDPSRWCIYRVPHSIRKGKEEAYTPQIVSIGPFHYGKEVLTDMEKQKQRYVKKFFERTNKKQEEVFNHIKKQEKEIRKCYSETSNLDSDEYVSMILRDAIFILELLLRYFEKGKSDNLLWIRAHRIALRLDLLLLENQLPYFLLEEIYNSIVDSPSFIDICLIFFRSLLFYPTVSDQKNFKHFTDLLTETLGQYPPEDDSRSVKYEVVDNLTPLPCATKLDESGVKFTPVLSLRLLNVRFEGGELSMPQFNVHLQTETVLRNTLAREQCHYQNRTLICDYVILLDSLIEDKRDAQFLVDAGIISNSMGDSKALASLFKKLRAEIPLNIYHYKKTCKDLNDYYNSKYNRNMAKLQRFYFPDIWRGTATIAAFVLLTLTLIQTIASLK